MSRWMPDLLDLLKSRQIRAHSLQPSLNLMNIQPRLNSVGEHRMSRRYPRSNSSGIHKFSENNVSYQLYLGVTLWELNLIKSILRVTDQSMSNLNIKIYRWKHTYNS